MENEIWDSALFDLKPAKFYLRPLKKCEVLKNIY